MRLESITIASVLGLARADLKLSSINVFAGDNAQGKSSLSDAISMALCGTPARVSKVKEYGRLLNDGSPKGRVTVTYDDDLSAEFRLPKGEHHADPVPNAELLPYVLNPQAFSGLSPEDRRTLLFRLTGCKANGKMVMADLEKIGVTGELSQEVSMWLKGGFPAACSSAEEKAKESKGAWRQVTGENWGSVKAEGWSAPKPEGEVPTAVQVTEQTKILNANQQNLEAGLQHLAKLESAVDASLTHANRLQRAKEAAEQLESREHKAAETQHDLTEWEARLPELEKHLSEVRAGVQPMICPCCDAELRIVDGTLVKFEGIKADTKNTQDAAMAVQEAKEAITTLRQTLQSHMSAVAYSQSAADAVKQIEAEQHEPVSDEAIEATKAKIAELREAVKAGEEWIRNAARQRDLRAGVTERTAQATKIHNDIKQWLAIAERFSPSGIPAELLADAMAPFNQSLHVLSGLCVWKVPAIDEDMNVLYGDRLYGLCSASEKWRADALIAIAIAQISGLRLVVLDGFDILHARSRQELVRMLIQLESLGALETSIILGTMKELPKFPAPVTAVWVQNGIAENVQ